MNFGISSESTLTTKALGDKIPCDRPKGKLIIGADRCIDKVIDVPEGSYVEDDRRSDYSQESSISNDHVSSALYNSVVNGDVFDVIAEGWLWKKGSGNDLIGSRSFKSRWSRLVLILISPEVAKENSLNPPYVPVLEIYWHQYSQAPSSIIILDEVNIFPVEKVSKGGSTVLWDTSYRIEIISRKSGECIKCVAAPKDQRDQWIKCLKQVVTESDGRKEKMKIDLDRAARLRELPPTPKRFVKPDRIRLKTSCRE